MDTPVTLIDLLRHGEPEGGPRFRGSVDDPLSATGWAQLAAATTDQQWDAIVCSPLRRCREFAQALAADRGVDCRIEHDFREISFGLWEGLTTPQVQADYGASLTRFWQDPVAHPPPQGEPLAAFGERVDAAWRRLAGDARRARHAAQSRLADTPGLRGAGAAATRSHRTRHTHRAGRAHARSLNAFRPAAAAGTAAAGR
jgi:alpha-ribazole phosphatase